MHTNVPNVDTIMMMNARMVLMFEFFIVMSFNCRFGLQRFRNEFDISKQWEKIFKISVGQFLEMQYLQGFEHEKKISNIFCDGCFGDSNGWFWMDG